MGTAAPVAAASGTALRPPGFCGPGTWQRVLSLWGTDGWGSAEGRSQGPSGCWKAQKTHSKPPQADAGWLPCRPLRSLAAGWPQSREAQRGRRPVIT